MKTIKFLSFVSLLAIFTSCVNSDEYNTPDLSGECVNLTATKSVGDITAASTTTATKYDNEDIIEAYVTSSDEGGNFYKSISFQSVDGTKGFSIPVDTYNLFNRYEPGRLVYVNMKDRYVMTKHSSTLIGSLYDGEVGRISGVEYEEVLKRGCTKVDEDDIVKTNLSLSAAKNNQYLNMLIEFDNVQFTDTSLGHTFFDKDLNPVPTWTATNHLITDASGATLIVRFSEYANFSSEMVPSGNGKIRGVLTKYNNDFQFMVRTINDIDLSNPRVVPIFQETFDSNFGSWIKYSVTGAQVWTLSTQYGNAAPCAAMSGFSGGNNVNEDWLISPNIDLTNVSNGVLSFDTASRYSGNLLEAKISTNYSGSGNPNAATWTDLSATLDTDTGSFVWTNSGAINLSAFSGSNVRIAFKYTSTSSASRTWEVDNVKVTN